MWPPLLFEGRSRVVQAVLAGVLPIVFGAVCGVLLGTSALWFNVLTTAGALGALHAGFEHVGWRAGLLRGASGGALFSLALLAVHEVRGVPALAPLPLAIPGMAAFYAVAGVPFTLVGSWLRGRRERAATTALGTVADGRESATVTVDGIDVTLDLARWPAASPAAHRRFLLVHGNPGHLEHFAPLVPGLQRFGEVVALDLPGYGTRRAPRPPSLDWNADVGAALARRLWPGERVVLIGQSFGGAVVLTMLVRHPNLANLAVALGTIGTPAHASTRTGARLARIPGAAAVAELLARTLRGPFGPAAVRWFARASFAPEAVPEAFAVDEARLIGARPWLLSRSLLMNLGSPSDQLAAASSRVRAPVLFVHGREDQLVPIPHARALFGTVAAASPTSSFVALEGGHMVHYTRPEAVLEAIAGFLR